MTDYMKMWILIETFKDFHHARRRTIGYCSNHVKRVSTPQVFPNNVTLLFPVIVPGSGFHNGPPEGRSDETRWCPEGGSNSHSLARTGF
jgi:hypothetical protein